MDISTLKQLIRANKQFKKVLENDNQLNFSCLIPSGELYKEHYDYGAGFYELSVNYTHQHFNMDEHKHCVRVHFTTVDDGCFGSWNFYKNKETAIKQMNIIMEVFSMMDRCPNTEDLNDIFKEYGVYFCLE